MNYILSFWFVICLVGLVSSQNDTIPQSDSIPHLIIQETLPKNQIFAIDCAHGHICCEVGCGCCAELHRDQKYDKLDRKLTDGIERVITGERYRIAASREITPIRIKFYKKGNLTGQYFSTKLPRIPEEPGKRYSWDYSHLDFSKPYEFVFDSTGEYQLINIKGEKQEIEFPQKYEISRGIYEVFVVINDRRISGLQGSKGEKLTGLKYQKIESVGNGQFIVRQYNFIPYMHFLSAHGKAMGVIDKKGEMVLPTNYAEVKYLGKGRYKVLENGMWYLSDDSGRILSKGHDYLGKLSEGKIAFRKNKKLGFLNLNGEVVIPAEFDWVYEFTDNRAAVSIDGKWGFINELGDIIVEIKYDLARSFDSGVAAVAVGPNSNSDKWGLIDTTGVPVKTTIGIDDVDGCKDGFCRVFINGSGDGILNSKGKIIVPAHYDILDYGTERSWFAHGRISVRDYEDDRKMYWINEKGRIIKELPDWDYVRPLFGTDGNRSTDLLPYYQVNKNRKWGLVDLEGNVIIQIRYRHIMQWTREYVLLHDDGKYWSYCLKTGKKYFLTNGELRSRGKDGVVEIQVVGQSQFFNVLGERVDMLNQLEK